MSFFLVCYDMVMIPISLAYLDEESGKEGFFNVMYWFVLLFWTADIPLSFSTGFFRNGVVEMLPGSIARHYIHTWFALDVLIVGSDWLGILLGSNSRISSLARVLRMLRIVRSLRLLRLMKLQKLQEEIEDRISSEYFHVVLGVLKQVLMLVCINHFIGCLWWSISVSTDEDTDAWTRKYVGATFADKYFTSMHWSLTQFTPASMEVIPLNVHERIFAVAILIFAMVFFSSFVSSITAAMTHLRQLSGMLDKHFSTLRRFLKAKNIPGELTVRILKYAKYRAAAKRVEIQEADVELLHMLSKPLQQELRKEIFAPVLTQHPFFRIYATRDAAAMLHMCSAAISQIELSSGDSLFTEASSAESMIFVLKGRLKYFPMEKKSKEEASPKPTPRTTTVSGPPKLSRSATFKAINANIIEEGDWCCEASLWTQWKYTGAMSAISMSKVLTINGLAFAKVTASYERVGGFSVRYGQAFVDMLCKEQAADTLNDLGEPVSLLERFAEQAESAGNCDGDEDSEDGVFNKAIGIFGAGKSFDGSKHDLARVLPQ